MANNQIQKKEPFSVTIRSDKFQRMLNNTIDDRKTRETFVTNMVTTVSANPSLQRCDASSLVSAGLQAVNLGLSLSPTLGYAYVVPYATSGGYRAQFQIGWKGLVQLAIRSGQFQHIDCGAVYEGEFLGYSEDREPQFKWDDTKHKGNPIGYYATFRLTNGFRKTIYWTIDEVKAHRRKYSKAQSGPWVDNFDSMACKTVLKSLISKWAPISIESPISEALNSDQKVYREDGEGYFDDNPLAPNDGDEFDATAPGHRSTVSNHIAPEEVEETGDIGESDSFQNIEDAIDA